MILDRETLGSRQRDRGPARGRRRRGRRRSSPSCIESVLEIATKPCPDTREAGAELRGLRRQVAEIGRPPRPRDRLGRHAPVRAAGRTSAISAPPALPRPHRRAALRRPPGDHLRAARARRHRRRRQGDPRRQRHARARADAARAVGQLAVLARPTATGLASTRMPIFRAFPRVGIPPSYDGLGGLRAADRLHGRGRARSRTTPTSGTTSARTRTSARSRSGRWTRRRGSSTRSALAALIQAMVKELAEHFEAGKQLARVPVRDARREPVARRRATGSTASSSTSRAATACPTQGARPPALRPPARARAGPRLRPPSSRRSRTSSSSGNGAAPAARGVRGEPRSPRGHAGDRQKRPIPE